MTTRDIYMDNTLTKYVQLVTLGSLLSVSIITIGCTRTTRVPPDAKVLSNSANSELRSGNYLEAIRLYTEFIELAEANEMDPSYAPYGSRAIAHFELQHFDLALRDSNRALLLAESEKCDDEARALLYYMRGKAYFKLGDQDKSSKDFQTARELDPTVPVWNE